MRETGLERGGRLAEVAFIFLLSLALNDRGRCVERKKTDLLVSLGLTAASETWISVRSLRSDASHGGAVVR